MFLCLDRYPIDSPLHQSDQITVPTAVWETLHADYDGGERPLFVQINPADDGPYARICPASDSDSVSDICQVPDWIWLRLGAPLSLESWIQLRTVSLSDAGSITLRPRLASTLTSMDEPLIQLATELTGGGAATHSWACLSEGSELSLPCGIFDIIYITNVEGYLVSGACILNMDVNLELEPATVRPPTPPPPPPQVLFPPLEDIEPSVTHIEPSVDDKRFPGVGYRLGGGSKK
jgi:hypothetical protein